MMETMRNNADREEEEDTKGTRGEEGKVACSGT